MALTDGPALDIQQAVADSVARDIAALGAATDAWLRAAMRVRGLDPDSATDRGRVVAYHATAGFRIGETCYTLAIDGEYAGAFAARLVTTAADGKLITTMQVRSDP